jgi:hypothetical protein
MFRAVVFLGLLAALGAAIAWLAAAPPPRGPAGPAHAGAPRQPASVASPAGGQAGLSTPFGDALFRWRCTTGLQEALGNRPDWPLERVAGLCLCAANRLREDGPRDIIVGAGDVAVALEAAEARLCRRR